MKKFIICLAALALVLSGCSAEMYIHEETSADETTMEATISNEFVQSNDSSSNSRPEDKDVFEFIIDEAEGRAGLADVLEAVTASAVCITVSGKNTNYFYTYTTELQASGVIISDDGYILTASHVVEGGDTFAVTLKDGASYDAALIASDRKCDIAVLKIDSKELKAVSLASSDSLRVGDFIFTVGNSASSGDTGAAFGFVSAMDTEITYNSVKRNMVQINACINSGNVGGGLFDSNGKLIGIITINSPSENSAGMAYALPSSDIATATEDLINHGYVRGRPCVGFDAVEINDMATAHLYGLNRLGLYVTEVAENSTAAQCGLQSKDYINAIDGETVISLERLKEIIASKKIGESVILEILRGDNTIDMVIVIEEEIN